MRTIEANLMKIWPTQILVDRLDDLGFNNGELADIARDYSDKKMIKYDSGFKHAVPNNLLLQYDSPALTQYFEVLQHYFWHYLQITSGLTQKDITKPVCHMFGNVEKRGQWSIPHAHNGNQVVITYYPEVTRDPDEPHPFAGHMIFHNPRNPASGFWARREVLFTPIITRSGTLVVFPAHAEHSTFPFFNEGSEKCALVCNIRFAGILEGEHASLQYQSFQSICDHREAKHAG